MKKLLIILSFVILTVSAFAQSQVGIRPWNWQPTPKDQFTTQSLSINANSSALSILYLNDGLNNSYTAFAYPVLQFTGLVNGKLGLFAIGAFSMSTPKTNVYAGTGLGYQLVHKGGWDVTPYIGLKGFDLTHNFDFQSGKNGAYVLGVGLTIPVR